MPADTRLMSVSLPDIAREAQQSFGAGGENAAALTHTANLSSYLNAAFSLGIFVIAGRCGSASCSTDLSGWHAVNFVLALVAISHTCWRDRTSPPPSASDDEEGTPVTPMDVLHARFSLGLGAIGLVWWIMLQVRVWGTHACATHEEGECCEPGLYTSSFWFLASTYVVLGIGCCCTFAMLSFFAGALSGAVAAGAANAAADESAAESSTSRGSTMPDLQVRLLGKGEQV
jgi:hypothetical protein